MTEEKENILDLEYNLSLLLKEGNSMTRRINMLQLELQQLKYSRIVNKEKQELAKLEIENLKNGK